MASRRNNGNSIQGPQSALTDFLASNNISALQIRQEYERRRAAAQQQPSEQAPEDGDVDQTESVETVEQRRKRKRGESAAVNKIKHTKAFQRRKAWLSGEPGEDDDDEIAWDMYAKSKPLPGQLENCDICKKRFTVTAYSKEGAGGGLLCAKCSKEHDAGDKKKAKPKRSTVGRDNRRQAQSNLLDGDAQLGAKSLQELCIRVVADHGHDIEEFGDLPPALLERLSQIFSKRRILTPRTSHLFLRPELDEVTLYDCGKLETNDFKQIFAIVPAVKRINLRNAGQMKDEVIDYILDRDVPLTSFQVEAANLVSDAKWREYFAKAGHRLETLKLYWLDFAMDDETISHLVRGCPNLKRLKIKRCFRLTDASLDSFAEFQSLHHLSLQFANPTTAEPLKALVRSVGANLRTLSLERFQSADDQLLGIIHETCTKLVKLRFTENDTCTDAGFASLFTDWSNPPLAFIDLSGNRDIDYCRPDGPDEPIGLASSGFRAVMAHSGPRLERLDISSCRHITHETLAEVFDGVKQYPLLRDINLSLLPKVDTVIVAGLFRSCPAIKKVTVFSCFGVRDVVVPAGVALIGTPHAQDTIVQEGDVTMNMWP